MTGRPVTVAALYKFTPFADPAALRDPLLAACEELGIFGTLLLAREGINGTIAGGENAIAAILGQIRALPGCAALEVKFSHADAMPFHRMKVRMKREIVTMGEPDIDPTASVGTYVEPQDWNALIADPDTVVIDTRNDYEVAIGTFRGAVDPHTASFRDFPAWFRTHRDELLEGRKRVAMFCTGGIRCEKSTAFLKAEGVEEVYHLKGGILKYLEQTPAAQSSWEGECFVFDERVAVGHGLAQGSYGLCRACRYPLSEADRAVPAFVEGVSCPHCIEQRDEAQRARYAERQKQEDLARRRGVAHVGARMLDQ
ncbi:MAG: rhodanese-related sulfurtransferase [Sphingomonadales bacterium]|nr:rhodanese-related sulfurtransferase [Sphingomonadales bacterium]MBD3775388.1 rhodanese-related sulfurtransferase [Paracoccaceae bacterium]